MVDPNSIEALEREAETVGRVKLLRRMIREFAVLRATHERLAADVVEFGQALERLENADPDAP